MDYAIGSYEAASILGVHWARPGAMVDRGEIVARHMAGHGDAPSTRIYSMESCEENWREYERSLATGNAPNRLRSRPEERQPMLVRLGQVQQHVDYDDAISVQEAADILGVWWTYVPRLVKSGKIVGRRLMNDRGTFSRMMVISRKSVESHAQSRSQED